MESMRSQGGIQMLLTAEQEAQQIISNARNLKLSRLRQAKDEAEREVAAFRSSLEAEYQRQVEEGAGSSNSNVKNLEAETVLKIQGLNEAGSRVSSDVVKMLLRNVTSVKI